MNSNELSEVLDRIKLSINPKQEWDGRHIYLVRCNEFVKIGIATNIRERLCEMQVGNPYKLELIKYWPSPNAVVEEEEIHQLLDQYRVRGEWFKLPAELVAAIV